MTIQELIIALLETGHLEGEVLMSDGTPIHHVEACLDGDVYLSDEAEEDE